MFLGVYKIKNKQICENLILLHQWSNDKKPGILGDEHGNLREDKSKKHSTDVSFNPTNETFKEQPILLNFLKDNLQPCLDKYVKKYPYANYYGKFGVTTPFNIQHYAPCQGYHAWHTERASNRLIENDRHLAWMMFLNDVKDGGQTEFFHQKKKITAERGKLLIWPCDWTFTHRGIVSNTEHKYIITGWFNFY